MVRVSGVLGLCKVWVRVCLGMGLYFVIEIWLGLTLPKTITVNPIPRNYLGACVESFAKM